MYIFNKRNCVLTLLAFGQGVLCVSSTQARLVYSTEEGGVHTPAFYLNQDDTSDDFVDLNFGTSAGVQLRYDVVNDDFTFNRSVDLNGNEIKNFDIERLAVAPTCDGTAIGRMYFNTGSSKTFVCDGTTFNVLENAGAITGADITDGSIKDEDLDLADITLADFTNDAGFLTTVDISDDTNLAAGTGATLTGDSISVDLGTSIDASEIDTNAVNDDEINYATVTLSDFTNDAGFITTDTDTTYTGSGGVTLTGTNFTADLGTSVDASEIDTDAVNDDEINYANVTLSDFTNDAGFVTTDNDTTYTGGTGITLTGTVFSNDLGTDIGIAEMANGGNNQVLTTTGAGVPQWEDKSIFATAAQGALAASALQSGDNVSALTNDAGYITTDTDTTYTGSGGVTLTGTNFTADLGTDISTAEIQNNAVDGAKLGIGTTAGDTLYFDGTDWLRLGLGTAGQVLQTNVGATAPEWGTVAAVDTDDQNLTLVGSTLNITDGTSADLSSLLDNTDAQALNLAGNDLTISGGAGSIDLSIYLDDTDTDTTYTGSGGVTLTGTNFTADLGTDIQTAEIGDDQVTVAKIGGAGNNQVLTSDGSGNPQWEDKSNFATSSLTTNNIFVGVGGVATDTAVSGDLSMIGGNFSLASNSVQDAEIDYSAVTLNDFTNDAGFVTTDNDTTYTGSGGVTLTGTNFTADLGTSVDATEIDTDAVNDDEINYANVTLADFTNDAGFITTDTDTTYTAGTGITLTGTTFSNDLGADIATGEIEDGTITFADLNNTDITLSDFTNDLGLSPGNLFVGSAFGVATSVAPSQDISVSLTGAFTITDNAVDGTDIALGSDTAGDMMFYNGTDWDRLAVGTAGQVLQVNGTADAPVWNSSTATKYQFLDIFGCIRGSASAGTVAGGNSAVVRFDGNNNSEMRCSFAVPDDWQAGTDINIETFYSPSDNTAGDVRFNLRHAAKAAGEVIATGDFTDTVAGAVAIAASTELQMYEMVEDIPAAGLALDEMVNINLRRAPGDASDTYAGDINIHMIRIAYTGKRLE